MPQQAVFQTGSKTISNNAKIPIRSSRLTTTANDTMNECNIVVNNITTQDDNCIDNVYIDRK